MTYEEALQYWDEHPPEYWVLNIKTELPAPRGLAPRNHKLRYNEARRQRRHWEAQASAFLEVIESITRYPAHVRGEEHSNYFSERPLEIQSYALSAELVHRAATLASTFLPPQSLKVSISRYRPDANS